MGLALRNLLFTPVVPGFGGVYAPWRILTHDGATPKPVAWPAVAVVALGAAPCFWVIARHASVHGRAGEHVVGTKRPSAPGGRVGYLATR